MHVQSVELPVRVRAVVTKAYFSPVMSPTIDGRELNRLPLKSITERVDKDVRLVGIGSLSWFPLRSRTLGETNVLLRVSPGSGSVMMSYSTSTYDNKLKPSMVSGISPLNALRDSVSDLPDAKEKPPPHTHVRVIASLQHQKQQHPDCRTRAVHLAANLESSR